MQHLSAIHEKYWSAKCTYFDGIECSIHVKYLFWLVGFQAIHVRHGVLELFVLLSVRVDNDAAVLQGQLCAV